MARSYTEKDLSFYTEKEVHKVRVDITNRGKVISWNPIEDIEGYAIYKGAGRTMKVNNQRFIKIVVKSTHNSIHNKSKFYPTKENVALAEVEVYVNGGTKDFTDTLPVTSFTASSSLSTDTKPQYAFDNVAWESIGKGWQSEKLKDNPFKQDHLNEWITIDLGLAVKVDKIRIKNSSDSIGLCGIYEYRIDVSEDGFFWTSLYEGSLNRDSSFQDIDLTDSFYADDSIEADWELLETVGSLTTTYLDGLSLNENCDYRVTGIIVGDISFEGTSEGYTDLKLTEEFESARQDITNRVRSQKGQWKRHDHLGSNLELLEGMKNTRETAQYGTDLIEESLTRDGRFYPADLKVRPVPKDITQVDYYIIATSKESDDPIVVVENINM